MYIQYLWTLLSLTPCRPSCSTARAAAAVSDQRPSLTLHLSAPPAAAESKAVPCHNGS